MAAKRALETYNGAAGSANIEVQKDICRREDLMGKYDALGAYLRAQRYPLVSMTFGEIEQLLQISLPASKTLPAWWSNSPGKNPMTQQWLESGYRTETVDVAGERLVFRRFDMSLAAQQRVPDSDAERTVLHSVFGCMKGTVTIQDGYDITQPADPAWGKVYEDG
jgi:hypothetical protein